MKITTFWVGSTHVTIRPIEHFAAWCPCCGTLHYVRGLAADEWSEVPKSCEACGFGALIQEPWDCPEESALRLLNRGEGPLARSVQHRELVAEYFRELRP